MTNDDPSTNARAWALWIEMLGPPVLWLIQFQIRYALVPWCCANGNRSLLWTSSGGSLVLAAVMLMMSWSSWRNTPAPPMTEEAPIGQKRARFMATVGLMSSSLFLLLIAVQAIPVLFIDPCIQ